MKKLFFATLATLSLSAFNSQAVTAAPVQFSLTVTRSDVSVSSATHNKEDYEAAVIHVFKGLGNGRTVYLRMQSALDGSAASNMVLARQNGQQYLSYLSGYGAPSRRYYINASKGSWLNTTIQGQF